MTEPYFSISVDLAISFWCHCDHLARFFLVKPVCDPNRVVDELDADHGDFEKAEQRHAEKQVQVAANHSDQRVDGHLGLFVYTRKGE